MKYILVLGNPDVGFSYRGPFEAESDVLQYAEYEMGLDIDWWVQPLKEPGETVRPTPRVSADDYSLIKKIIELLDDMEVSFIDGNPTNVSISNIVMIPKKRPFSASKGTTEEVLADGESYQRSLIDNLPGIEQHDILDRVMHEPDDIPF